jgi:hypothetical protein
MSQRRGAGLLSAAAVVGVVGTVLATITPLVGGAPQAFVGSVVTSGLVGLVFAGQNALTYVRHDVVSLPAATLTTIFGGWFMIAPLVYDVGFIATAGTQLAGLLVAAFALYMVVADLAGEV